MENINQANKYIKECEERERLLLEEKRSLVQQLHEAQEALKNVPEDHKALMVDLKQSKHEIEFYRKLMKENEQKANDYCRRWKEAVSKLGEAQEAVQAAHRTEQLNQDAREAVSKLMEENRIVRTLVDEVEKSKSLELASQRQENDQLRDSLHQSKLRNEELEQHNTVLEETYNGLVEKLEDDNIDNSASINRMGQYLSTVDKYEAAVWSEFLPLMNFVFNCNNIFIDLHAVFKSLFDNSSEIVIDFPKTLEEAIKDANEDINKYAVVSQALDNGGHKRDRIRIGMQDMAHTEVEMLKTMIGVKKDLEEFLKSMRKTPELWVFLRRKYSKLGERIIL
ncbi:hypothetical protein BS50DRAFT_642524 [Corynespora cassiicola Philippines]|uniref:Uncharacterized protein n=1 Tax=Corynespora cassiicola Philippines TaxID=1448308 RepID=A0A2T2P9N6_CORCC|nr:hypothetical protein BS50DRAFT_642524 [Corynespora cassiicola Philippines]